MFNYKYIPMRDMHVVIEITLKYILIYHQFWFSTFNSTFKLYLKDRGHFEIT